MFSVRRASEATESQTDTLNTYSHAEVCTLHMQNPLKLTIALSSFRLAHPFPFHLFFLLSSPAPRYVLFPSSLEAVQCNMLLLICNNTWQGQINGSYTTNVPEARLTGTSCTYCVSHYIISTAPHVMGTFFFLKGQPLTSATAGITHHHHHNTSSACSAMIFMFIQMITKYSWLIESCTVMCRIYIKGCENTALVLPFFYSLICLCNYCLVWKQCVK